MLSVIFQAKGPLHLREVLPKSTLSCGNIKLGGCVYCNQNHCSYKKDKISSTAILLCTL